LENIKERTKMKQYKIYTDGTLRDKFKQCFKDGYRPLTIEEVFKYQNGKDKLGTYCSNGIRKCKHIIITKKTDFDTFDGQLWWVGSLGYYCSANGYYNLLDVGGRLIGVKVDKKRK
jgi:hypothetical protein